MKSKKISADELVAVLNDELKNFKDTVNFGNDFKKEIDKLVDKLCRQIFDGVVTQLGIDVPPR